MKKVYVYNFLPMNEIRIHTIPSEKEFQDICNTVHSECDRYKIISQFDVDDKWENVTKNVVYTLNRIFEELGSVIQFYDLGEYYSKHAIKPVIYTNGDPFIDSIYTKFNDLFYDNVVSILSDFGMESIRCRITDFNCEETILFCRKEDVKG